MKKVLLVVVLVVVLAFAAACAETDSPADTAGAPSGEAVGSVNGVDLYRDEFDYYFSQYFMSYFQNYYSMFQAYYGIDMLDEASAESLLADMEYAAWQEMLNMEAIRQIATQDYGIEEPSYYLQDVLDYASYRNLIINSVYNDLFYAVQAEMLEALTISDEDARAKYEEDPAAWDSRSTSHILLKFDTTDEAAREEAYAEAIALIERLQAGEDFATLAQENSDDGSAADGGKIDSYVNVYANIVDGSGSLYTEYVDAAFSLENIGDFTLEPVLSSAGYHIIKLDDIREGFDASKEYIMDSMKTVSDEEVQAELNTMISEKLETAEIVEMTDFRYYDPAAAEATDESGEAATDESGEAATDESGEAATEENGETEAEETETAEDGAADTETNGESGETTVE